mmetsp:Transcript_42994/g.97227  ORF Transcript_42994/g.97227 Transcript_42994/m.97227 type:complete len:467 (-) Transcript_42994:310-1710(-)|eukprot:CAMPEP_0172653846 /NCGR_PEP_ID=MMETSP1068-20121228/244034_1 /TAXON_ID=35684 /ORGANISM="Pseudopedinella elastica, Strain CCMP716" /LENGTH=466 /DNA_ID=CAMNT_0013468285 /DNA_START=580 /DNA_END=1980 /DNA_ORIENTATION=-
MAAVESPEAIQIADLAEDLDTLWLLLGTVLVFIMQPGFAMVEVGHVNAKNTRNILLKNVLEASIAGIMWWLVGYGLAFGSSPSRFIGTDQFLLRKQNYGTGYEYAFWVFQWAFAATSATIVSGAIAERCTIRAYMAYSVCLIGFIYPIVVQMTWGSEGYMSPFIGGDKKGDYFYGCGVIDFAGSGVVHLTGGVAALVATYFIGPRRSFLNDTIHIPDYAAIFQTLGTLLLWFGWFGFNAGSTLAIVGYGKVAARVFVVTALGASAGALGTLIFGSALDSYILGKPVIKLEYASNGVLCGLVSITAGCSVITPYGAVIIGLLSSFVYIGGVKLFLRLEIDDVVGACPVHGFCGFFGMLMVGFFATKGYHKEVYGLYDGAEDTCAGVFYGGDGSQLLANFVFSLFVMAWVGGLCTILFGVLRYKRWLRILPATEEEGMDSSEHGAPKKDNLDQAPPSQEAAQTQMQQD